MKRNSYICLPVMAILLFSCQQKEAQLDEGQNLLITNPQTRAYTEMGSFNELSSFVKYETANTPEENASLRKEQNEYFNEQGFASPWNFAEWGASKNKAEHYAHYRQIVDSQKANKYYVPLVQYGGFLLLAKLDFIRLGDAEQLIYIGENLTNAEYGGMVLMEALIRRLENEGRMADASSMRSKIMNYYKPFEASELADIYKSAELTNNNSMKSNLLKSAEAMKQNDLAFGRIKNDHPR